MAPRTQGGLDAAQCRRQVLVGQEDLRDVAGHQREVHLQGRQCSRVATDPTDLLGSGLLTRHFERGLCRIHRNDVEASTSEATGQRARAAPHVEQQPGTQLVDDPLVVIEVVPRPVEVVVEPGEWRISELGVGHPGTLATRSGHQI